MKKIIDRKTYNTETSKRLASVNVGEYGMPDGYEEHLFETKSGLYFLYGLGGPESKYPQESIVPVKKSDAKKILLQMRG